jgi:hypothetical protein
MLIYLTLHFHQFLMLKETTFVSFEQNVVGIKNWKCVFYYLNWLYPSVLMLCDISSFT